MVTNPNDPFLAEAYRIAEQLARAALRDGGRATWLAADFKQSDLAWRRSVRTLDASLATGTAGVGWFLARLGAMFGHGPIAEVAAEAIRHALDRGDRLIADGRHGWYEGSLGVAWAAIDAGRVMGSAELVDGGHRLSSDTLSATATQSPAPIPRSLVGGVADVLVGVMGLADAMEDPALLTAGADHAARLRVQAPPVTPRGTYWSNLPPVGLARGDTGVALALAIWSSLTDDATSRSAATATIRAERRWFDPSTGWTALPAHDWQGGEAAANASWCSGAAGVGAARLALYSAFTDMADLADLTASIELLRSDLIGSDGGDASLCHGAAGAVDLMTSVGATFGEPAHLAAARTAGVTLMQQAARHGRYGTAMGGSAQNASILYGLAGTGLAMLRLSDGGRTPALTLPPFLIRSVATAG